MTGFVVLPYTTTANSETNDQTTFTEKVTTQNNYVNTLLDAVNHKSRSALTKYVQVSLRNTPTTLALTQLTIQMKRHHPQITSSISAPFSPSAYNELCRILSILPTPTLFQKLCSFIIPSRPLTGRKLIDNIISSETTTTISSKDAAVVLKVLLTTIESLKIQYILDPNNDNYIIIGNLQTILLNYCTYLVPNNFHPTSEHFYIAHASRIEANHHFSDVRR